MLCFRGASGVSEEHRFCTDCAVKSTSQSESSPTSSTEETPLGGLRSSLSRNIAEMLRTTETADPAVRAVSARLRLLSKMSQIPRGAVILASAASGDSGVAGAEIAARHDKLFRVSCTPSPHSPRPHLPLSGDTYVRAHESGGLPVDCETALGFGGRV